MLLSILLTKSWPKEHSGTNRDGLNKRTVEFLLTWNPMAGYLKFFGIYNKLYSMLGVFSIDLY